MRKMMRSAVLIAAAMLVSASGSLMAQTGFGVRAGVTADPNQFHFGLHYISEPLIPRLSFRPNLEIGLGSDVTTVAANFEFAYRIPVPKSDFSAYIGAGPALNVYRFDDSRGRGTDTGGGFNVPVGLEHEDGLFGELKVGTVDSPELKFTIGFTFE